LHHPIARLGEICSEVMVVIAPDADPPVEPPGVRVRVVRDAEPFEGPLAGLSAALDAIEAELALVVGGDMPDLQSRVMVAMLGRAGRPSVDAVALEEGGAIRPLPSVVRVVAARTVARGLLDRHRTSLRDLLGALDVVRIEESDWRTLDPDRRTLIDIDEPADAEGG
jgi:molybdopterin-guanine dinucleotide biosynthesis protein A